ncbi:MAG: ExeA family protein [Planctomycetaceae bacterium]
MYENYWGLAESPFAPALDPRWFVATPGHEEALARALFVVEQRRACGLLTGPAGVGKSLLLRVVQTGGRRLPCEAVLLDLLGRSAREMLWDTAAALGLGPRPDDTPRALWRALHDHVSSNRIAASQTVLLFDHLDRADPACTTTVERLAQLAADPDNALTVIVATQSDRLSQCGPALSQLADLQIHLGTLGQTDTAQYIESRIAKAGASRRLFEETALQQVFAESRGIPRQISRLCEVALLAGAADESPLVTSQIVAAAALQCQPIHRPLGASTRRVRGAVAEI